nr:antibiotic biosynthesis monooxygenase [Pinirhizobacter soli]
MVAVRERRRLHPNHIRGGAVSDLAGRIPVAVIFQVEPDPERIDTYLGLAASLAPQLAAMPGFIENERFRSQQHPCRLVSLSLWEDEAAAIGWREHGPHRAVQQKGRSGLLKGYRIRVGEIASGPLFAPGSASDLILLQSLGSGTPGEPVAGIIDELAADGLETFVNIRDQGHALVLIERSHPLRDDGSLPAGISLLRVRVLRDYGLTERAEAPHA